MKQVTFILSAVVLLAFTQCKPKAPANNNTQTVAASEFSKADITSITNKEISMWEFGKTKQADKLNGLLADDYQAFFGKVLMNKAEVIRNFQASDISNYRLFNIRTKKVNDDAAIIYYEALQNAKDADGDQWVPNVAVSTIYGKRGGSWYPVFYHETPILK